METLVTWANWFLWSNLTKKLVEKWINVVALDLEFNNPIIKNQEWNIKYEVADLLDKKLLEWVFNRNNISRIYHCVWSVSYDDSQKNDLYKINQELSKSILDIINEMWILIERIIYVGSTASYFTQPVKCFWKNQFNPESERKPHKYSEQMFYWNSKLQWINEVKKFIDKWMDIVIANPSTITWKGDIYKKSQWGVIDFIENQRSNIVMPGRLSTVDVEDLVDGLILAMEKWKIGEEYIFSDIHTSIKEISELLRIKLWKKDNLLELPFWTYYPLEYFLTLSWLFNIFPKEYKNLLYIFYTSRLFDSSKTRQSIWWKPTKTLDKSLQEALSYYKSIN